MATSRTFTVKNDQPALPPWHKMALSASKAAGRVIKAAVTQKPVYVDSVTRIDRLEKCRACDWLRSDMRCAHPNCGCHINRALVDKTRFATEKCPDEKW